MSTARTHAIAVIRTANVIPFTRATNRKHARHQKTHHQKKIGTPKHVLRHVCGAGVTRARAAARKNIELFVRWARTATAATAQRFM